MEKSLKRWIFGGVFGVIVTAFVFSGFYIVPEGHVVVLKHLGKAVNQTDPGLQFKIPFLQTTEQIEVRERKNSETMNAATANQLPATATVSMNWTVNKEAATDLFIQYGGLAQFEERVLDPRMRSASKAALSRYAADQIIRERALVVEEIQREIVDVTNTLPITVSQVQLEDIQLPKTYLDAVLAKEQAREVAEQEKHKLVQQKLVAQQIVQTADAERDADKSRADGRAYKIKTEATAEADAISLVNKQLAKSPLYIELVRAKAWNGIMPTTMLSDTTGVLFQVPGNR